MKLHKLFKFFTETALIVPRGFPNNDEGDDDDEIDDDDVDEDEIDEDDTYLRCSLGVKLVAE